MLNIHQLSYDYGIGNLYKLSNSFAAGELVKVAGPNGSGKSTFLKQLAGILPSDKSSIQVQKGNFASTFAYLSADHNNLHLNLNALANLQVWQQIFRQDSLNLNALLENWGLPDTKEIHALTVRQFSTGMKRRLSLAITEVIKPYCLLLDEPSFGLDTKGNGILADYILKAKKHGQILFVVNHQSMDIKFDKTLEFGKELSRA